MKKYTKKDNNTLSILVEYNPNFGQNYVKYSMQDNTLTIQCKSDIESRVKEAKNAINVVVLPQKESILHILDQIPGIANRSSKFKTNIILNKNINLQYWEIVVATDKNVPTYIPLLGNKCFVCDIPTKLGCEVCLKPACSSRHHICDCVN